MNSVLYHYGCEVWGLNVTQDGELMQKASTNQTHSSPLAGMKDKVAL